MTEPRHGDPFDYPDIPGDSGLGDEYFEATTPPHIKAAIANRRLAKIPFEATAGRPGWVLIDHKGVLYRGPALGLPQERWNPLLGWRPYASAGEQKPMVGGSIITEAEAIELMRELAGAGSRPQDQGPQS